VQEEIFIGHGGHSLLCCLENPVLTWLFMATAEGSPHIDIGDEFKNELHSERES
jgi:hypothetical protein